MVLCRYPFGGITAYIASHPGIAQTKQVANGVSENVHDSR